MELSVIPEEQVVRDDRGPVASESVRRPSPELDIEASVVTCVDQDQVEGEIPAGFGMYDQNTEFCRFLQSIWFVLNMKDII